MDLSFLSKADAVVLEMEKAKRDLETAKSNYEIAKRNYEEFLAQAEEFGVPKAKLKKLAEDRVQMLFESGIMDFLEEKDEPQVQKKPRKPKRPVAQTADEAMETSLEASVSAEPPGNLGAE
jgi:hypothetical protein